MRIRLIDADEEVEMSLEEFFGANADGIDDAEQQTITEHLRLGDTYRIAGAQSLAWTIERVA
jgi:hypothetical protein